MVRRSRRCVLQAGLGLAGVGLLSGCGMVAPQPPPRRSTKLARIGTLTPNGLDPTHTAALLQGLLGLDWVERETLAIEYRWAKANDALLARAAELIDLNVDVIVAAGNEPIRAAGTATGTIPIVMAVSDDPVGAGLVASLAHPGGNVTGLTNLGTELGAKDLQLLKEAAPWISRVAIVWDREILGGVGDDPGLGIAAGALDLQIEPRPFGAGHLQLGEALEGAAAGGADAILLLSQPLGSGMSVLLRGFFVKNRLPTMAGDSESAHAGSLLAYGPSVPDLFRRAATHVDKILRGVKPADLPVERPTTFDFIVNLKTAQAIGLTIPQSVLTQATEIIQ